MKACIEARDIPKEIKGQLEVIPDGIFTGRECNYCEFYAGLCNRQHMCMMKKCICENDKEMFHPVLLELRETYRSEINSANARIEVLQRKSAKAKENLEILEGMFKRQLEEEEKKKDECYDCPYAKGGPCIRVSVSAITN